MQKRQDIRKNMRFLRNQLSPAIQQQASNSICAYLQDLPDFRAAEKIAFYWAVNQEIDLFPLTQHALDIGKQCFLPVCVGNSLNFVSYQTQTPLKVNQYKIPEPDQNEAPIQPQCLDLVFVPLLAFDGAGNRVGSGLGFYDRSFAFLNSQLRRKPKLLGVGYGFQQVESLQAEVWDVQLDGVVSYDDLQASTSTVIPAWTRETK